jgi:hypothetical protein
MVECIGQPYARPLQNREAGCIYGGQLVQIGPAEALPRLLQVTQLANQDFQAGQPVNRVLPCDRHVARRIAIDKGERLDDNRHGGVQSGVRSAQQLPLPARPPVQGRAPTPMQSMHRYRRRPALLAASSLVINAVVIDRGVFWLTVPDRNRTVGRSRQHDLADRFANQRRDATPRRRYVAPAGRARRMDRRQSRPRSFRSRGTRGRQARRAFLPAAPPRPRSPLPARDRAPS